MRKTINKEDAAALLNETETGTLVVVLKQLTIEETLPTNRLKGPELLAWAAELPEERFCRELAQGLLEKLPQQTLEKFQGFDGSDRIELETDAQALIADAALKELAVNDCELLRQSHFDDPDLLEDLRSLASLEMPQATVRQMDAVCQDKRRNRPQRRQNLPGLARTDQLAKRRDIQTVFKDCLDGLYEMKSLILERFPGRPEEADRIAEEGLSKAFAASVKSVEASNQIQKARAVAR